MCAGQAVAADTSLPLCVHLLIGALVHAHMELGVSGNYCLIHAYKVFMVTGQRCIHPHMVLRVTGHLCMINAHFDRGLPIRAHMVNCVLGTGE